MRFGVAVSIAAALTATALAPQLASASDASGGSMVIQPTRTPTTPGGGAFTAVSCKSATKCIGVGGGAESPGFGFADKWNGTKWNPLTISEPSGVTQSALRSEE